MVGALSEADVLGLQDQFLSDLEDIVHESIDRSKKLLVMLSGGTDSFLLVAVLRHLIPGDQLYTVTIEGLETDDSEGAKDVAKYFNTLHQQFKISVEDVLTNIDCVKGKKYDKPRTFMSHICYQICLQRYDVGGCIVYSGHGADYLQGSAASYEGAEELAMEESCSLDEARTMIKVDTFDKKVSIKRHLSDIVADLGGTMVMPFHDRRLDYIGQLPFEVINPIEKSFVKDAIRRRYGLGDIVERPRIGMQDGTGLYYPMKSELKKRYGKLGGTRRIVQILSE